MHKIKLEDFAGKVVLQVEERYVEDYRQYVVMLTDGSVLIFKGIADTDCEVDMSGPYTEQLMDGDRTSGVIACGLLVLMFLLWTVVWFILGYTVRMYQ